MDINLFRKGGNPNMVKESQRRRGKPAEDVDYVINLDEDWRKLVFELNQANKTFNSKQQLVHKMRKSGEDTSELIEENKHLKQQIADLKKKLEEKSNDRDDKLYSIGNLVHQSVPVSINEEDNEIVRKHGECPQMSNLKHHFQLLQMINGFEPAMSVACSRGYYLKGWGSILNQALINYGLSFLSSKGYIPVQPPLFIRKSVLSKVADGSEIEDHYKIESIHDEDADPRYLISSGEHSFCALHIQETINPKDLPIKYVGHSTCFRKEKEKLGKDVRGIFRVHQFDIVEQFVFCAPDKSWEMMEEIMCVTEEFYKSLGLPYRIVNIISGNLNNTTAKQYDLEAWFPAESAYRQLVSCSNCTDYRSRRLEIKYSSLKAADGSKVYVHTLNSTLCATERTLSCLLENNQTDKGIRIPNVLKPYLENQVKHLENPDLIPYA